MLDQSPKRAGSIKVSGPMACSTELAVRGRLGVVHSMLHRLQSAEVSEYRLQVLVGQVTIVPPRHNLAKLSSLDVAGSNHLHELCFVVVGNSRRIRSDVGTGHFAPRPFQYKATCELQPLERLTLNLLGVAVGATRNGNQVFATLGWRGEIWRRHWSGNRLGGAPNQVLDGEY